MKIRQIFLVLFVAFLGVSSWYFFAPESSDASGIVIVSADTAVQEGDVGWMFNRDASTATAYTFVPGVGSAGVGSLYAGPITNTNYSNIVGNSPSNDKFIAEYFPGNILVSNLSSFSYDAKLGTTTDTNLFYLNVYANIDSSSNFYDCRYDYQFTSITAENFVKHVVYTDIAPTNIQKRGDRIATCPAVLSSMPTGSTIRAIAINLGDTSQNDTGLSAYIDNVEIIVAGDATYFDFEPLPQRKEDCQKDGWKRYGFKNQGQCLKEI